jgi:hypothetical protein
VRYFCSIDAHLYIADRALAPHPCQVEMAYEQSATNADRIAAATLSVRLHLIGFHVQGVFEQVDRVFRLLDSDLEVAKFVARPISDQQCQSPRTADSLTQAVDAGAEVDDDDPIHSEATAFAIFMVGCGPTLYTRLPAHAEPWFDFGTSVILRSRRALMHPATGYTMGVRAILFAGQQMYETAVLYMELGLGIPWRDTPWGECARLYLDSGMQLTRCYMIRGIV